MIVMRRKHETLVIAMRGKNEAFVSLVRDLASDRTCRLTAPLHHSSMIHKIVEHTYICVKITLKISKQYQTHNISIKVVGSCPTTSYNLLYLFTMEEKQKGVVILEKSNPLYENVIS